METKARWFQSLTLSDRMDLLCAFTDLALSANPALQECKDARPVAGRIQVLSTEDVIRPTDSDGRRLFPHVRRPQ